MATAQSEAAIQKDVRAYLSLLGIDSLAIPNGAVLAGDKASRCRQMAKLKATGLMPGAADLLLLDRRFVRRVGFFEIKREGGRLEASQKAFADLCESVWHIPYAVVRSLNDVAETLAQWGWR
jgi:hypothetical protein